MLNLSLVCAVVAGEGFLVLGLAGHRWAAAIGWAIVGVVCAWFCYQAAVNQAREVGAQIKVAVNLYHREILNQLDLDGLDTIAAERALWQNLTLELLGQPCDTAPTRYKTVKAKAAADDRQRT